MELTLLVDGLAFPEGPRWHDGRLWFSDFYQHQVFAVGPDGHLDAIVEVPNQPSGLGWLPDGRLVVVSMIDHRLLVFDGDELTERADLSGLASGLCNDMVVDDLGRAYVGNFGFDLHGGAERHSADLVLVDVDGSARVVAEALEFPNGTVITPDGATLIAAETYGRRLTAWDRLPNGDLAHQRVWADLGDGVPDGICLDAEGAIWVSDPRHHEVFRVREGGEVVQRVAVGDERQAFACMLGGPARTTLYLCTNVGSGPAAAEHMAGRIEFVEVAVPAAGWP